MVLSRNIEYVKYMDSAAVAPDLADDFSGFALVDFCVVPHATNMPFRKAAAKILETYKNQLDLRPISNNQAIAIEDGVAHTLTT